MADEGELSKRAPAFTKDEEELLAGLCVAKQDDINPDGKARGGADQIRQAAWADITKSFNSSVKCQFKRNKDQLYRRYSQLKSSGKDKFAKKQKRRRKTGGGSRSPSPDYSLGERVLVDHLSDTPAFQGVGSTFEAGIKRQKSGFGQLRQAVSEGDGYHEEQEDSTDAEKDEVEFLEEAKSTPMTQKGALNLLRRPIGSKTHNKLSSIPQPSTSSSQGGAAKLQLLKTRRSTPLRPSDEVTNLQLEVLKQQRDLNAQQMDINRQLSSVLDRAETLIDVMTGYYSAEQQQHETAADYLE